MRKKLAWVISAALLSSASVTFGPEAHRLSGEGAIDRAAKPGRWRVYDLGETEHGV